MLKRSWNTGTSSYVQRARTNFTTKFATNSLFTLLPHRCVSVLCYMALYVFARLWAAVLDGWLAYNKSCFNSSSMHICFGTFFFCDVSFYPFTTHYWFAPCHCQDRPMGTSSDWSKIKKSPYGQHPDGQIHVMTARARRRQRIFESIQTKHTDTSIWEEESVVLIDCFDRWEETIGLWCLRSLLTLHVRLTMMPHFINVLHQNCHKTTDDFSTHHPLARHLRNHQIFNRARGFVRAHYEQIV
jgi:hypothetical protein